MKLIGTKDYQGKKRYYSKEHEDMSLTALIIFKDNYLNGVGIKTFYKTCNFYKAQEKEKNINYLDYLNRNNKITCSTHHIIHIYKFYLKSEYLDLLWFFSFF